jgi:hypothetical protein
MYRVLISRTARFGMVRDLAFTFNHSASGFYCITVTAAAGDIVRRIAIP